MLSVWHKQYGEPRQVVIAYASVVCTSDCRFGSQHFYFGFANRNDTFDKSAFYALF